MCSSLRTSALCRRGRTFRKRLLHSPGSGPGSGVESSPTSWSLKRSRWLRPCAVVHAVYAFGANPPALSTPGWGRVRGLIAEGQLRLTSPGGATVIYRMASIDTLEAFYDPQGFRPLYARMQRMKD